MAEHIYISTVPVCTLSTHFGSKGRIPSSQVSTVLLN
jgi:hypothetical protein